MSRLAQLGQDLRPVLRFAAGYRRFAREPVSGRAALAHVQAGLGRREEAFLRFAETRIYGHPRSPYLPLLRAAGCGPGDMRAQVTRHGIEPTLRALADAGVRVSLDEFKGRAPGARAGGLEALTEGDFDNPHLAHQLEIRSGGTRSPGTRILVDLDFIRAQALDTALALDAHGLRNITPAVWMAVGGVAPVAILTFIKLGLPPARWFNQGLPQTVGRRQRGWTRFLVAWGRLMGTRFPAPEHAAIGDAPRVARWMAGEVQAGRRPCLFTYASSAVRVCLAAAQENLDLRRAAFIATGEPLTGAKRRAIEGVGATVLARYGLNEAGLLGYGCATPAGPDDLHLFTAGLALIRYPRPIGPGRIPVEGLLVTSLRPESPKVLLNVDTGDCAEMVERECGCLLGRAGLRTHLAEIRSLEKLTGEGMTFVGTRLIQVLEEILPARFGGSPADYQLVEVENAAGMTRLELRVDPGVGPVNEARVAEIFFAYLDERPGLRSMGEIWKQAGILDVRRVAPLATPMGKILPFHLQGVPRAP